jgi:uncharacterized protein (TIGR03084 family)
VEEIVGALTEQQEELSGLLAGLDDAGWARPSRCEGWDVADVVLHLAQTNELAIGSASGEFEQAMLGLWDGTRGPAMSIDEAADVVVARDRGMPPSAIRDRWELGARSLRELLLSCDPHARVTWVAGQLSARTLATTRLAETWIHTGDVAEALGVELAPTERLRHIARLAWRTLPYAFARDGRELAGPVELDLTGPGGAPWHFVPDDEPVTRVRGDGVELCLVAARRVDPAETGLVAEGPDARAVLELVRTYA